MPSNVYVSESSLQEALARLHGTADYMLRIWFTLKQMGMADGRPPIVVNTSNPADSLRQLFSCGAADGMLFVPFAHSERYKTMKADAGRSIIQTNLVRWSESKSVVGTDPTSFLDISIAADRSVLVSPSRMYPIGLGVDKNGFAPADGKRCSIPILSFSLWYYRTTPLPISVRKTPRLLIEMLRRDLNLSLTEEVSIFLDRDDVNPTFDDAPISNKALFTLCTKKALAIDEVISPLPNATLPEQIRAIRTMKTISDRPAWLNVSPQESLKEVLEAGQSSVLLFGPPRTGKTRAIRALTALAGKEVVYIQIHDGWTYDNLMEMFAPNSDGKWDWIDGPLKRAIDAKAKFIVLEEANRTNLSQALGEAFSLIETGYRGAGTTLTLRSGRELHVDPATVLLLSMNTVDKSTEDVDDALFGRVAAVEFPPRIEDLAQMLDDQKLPDELAAAYRELWVFVQDHYPLGHGYFSEASKFKSPRGFYRARVRPVLYSYFQAFNRDVLALIDNKADELLKT